MTIATVLVLASCTGVIGAVDEGAEPGVPPNGSPEPGEGPDENGNPGPSRPPDPFDVAPSDPTTAGPLPLRALTRLEYENTVFELLGVTVDSALRFPAESNAETGFWKVQKIDEVHVAAYQDAALAIAASAASDLPSVLGCDPVAGDEAACIGSFIEDFGSRAYRRPLTADEVTAHASFYEQVLKTELGLPTAEAAELLLAAMLQSPHFLYRWELGSAPLGREGDVVQLNGYHLASQLSYFLWRSMPDPMLFGAAASGELESAAGVEAQVRRMLDDSKAAETIATFHEQWLGLGALPELGKSGQYPTWNPALGAAMAEEVRRFTTNAILDGDGRLSTLFTSRSSFVNEPLAALYGISGVSGTELVPHTLPESERAGLFTLAGFLTSHSGEVEGSPIFRGKFIRERVLCDPMKPPPPNIPDLPEPSADIPKRERYVEHSEVSPCKDCHIKMDYIGFGFEHYDAIGAYHETDGQFPIDATGQVHDLDGESPSFDGAEELVALLTESEQVRQCVTKEWFRYAFARREAPEDRASFDAAYAAFAAADYDVRELLVAFTTSRSFRYRSIAEGEDFE